MHQTRIHSTTKLPIERKGTKYIARASSHINNSVPVVIAVRDMLKLARTAKEVRGMIKNKALKINGRQVEDYRESIRLFNVFEAGKPYELSLLETKKFFFQPASHKDARLCKVVSKKLLKGNTIQLNLHDGTNVLSKDKITVNDSIYLGLDGKIKKHIPLSKDKESLVISGRYMGKTVKIDSIKDGKVSIKVNGGSTSIPASAVVVL